MQVVILLAVLVMIVGALIMALPVGGKVAQFGMPTYLGGLIATLLLFANTTLRIS